MLINYHPVVFSLTLESIFHNPVNWVGSSLRVMTRLRVKGFLIKVLINLLAAHFILIIYECY